MSVGLKRATPVSTRAGRRGRAVGAWMVLSCAILGASGAARRWQDDRFSAMRGGGGRFPTLPSDLPVKVGQWRLQEGEVRRLDPKVARIAGCSDHLVGTYVDDLTGVKLTLLVLVGPADAVFGHTPAVCYAAVGYKPIDVPMRLAIPVGLGSGRADFCSEVFARGEGGAAEREEVTHAFRFNGRWTPDASGSWRLFRYGGAMFKVQASRRVAENERRHLNNPAEQFLGLFLPEFDRGISTSRP